MSGHGGNFIIRQFRTLDWRRRKRFRLVTTFPNKNVFEKKEGKKKKKKKEAETVDSSLKSSNSSSPTGNVAERILVFI